MVVARGSAVLFEASDGAPSDSGEEKAAWTPSQGRTGTSAWGKGREQAEVSTVQARG